MPNTSAPQSNVTSVKIGGQAGQGIKSAGLLLAKSATRSGYNIFNYIEYPSLIRGGHNVMQINISKDAVMGSRNKTDILIALNQETIDFHFKELTEGAIVLFDEGKKLNVSNLPTYVHQVAVPLSQIAQEAGGKELLSNTVALGATIAILNGNIETLCTLLSDEFAKKGDVVINANIAAAKKGFEFVKNNFQTCIKDVLVQAQNITPKMVVNGDEAVAMGAIAAGLQFASIYPMSPISNILHTLALHQEKFGYIYKQPEDEISAITMAIGASYAGVRSMTASSGGGFSLMAEGYGLAGMTETPLVIIEGMRGAPATGIPTWNEQGDLRFVLHAHQGDFPRIVLAAGDAIEAFYLTMEAFSYADKYQTPVLLLIDKNICDNDQSTQFFDVAGYRIDRGKFTKKQVENYKRFELSQNGVSTRTIPGSGNFFVANSDEHDEYGLSSEEIDNRNNQMNKRMQKLITCEKEDMQPPMLYGPKEADLTIVSWGSNKGSILEAMAKFPNVNYIHVTWMNPFPTDSITKILSTSKNIVDIECNYTGQLAGLIREKTGIEIKNKWLKFDGRPFYVEELEDKISNLLKELK